MLTAVPKALRLSCLLSFLLSYCSFRKHHSFYHLTTCIHLGIVSSFSSFITFKNKLKLNNVQMKLKLKPLCRGIQVISILSLRGNIHIFGYKATFFYLLDYVTLGRISKCGDQKKKIKIKIEPKPKLCKIISLL